MPDRKVHNLTPQEAWQMLQENPRAILIDVRSTMEYLFVGHPVGAVHVSWIDEPDWKVNPHFVTKVREVMLGGATCQSEGCAPLILICRSGKRSLEAGNALIEDGFSDVYHIDEGFEGERDENHQRSTLGGWRFRGLPWEQC
jgi:rhodanese-related sulfurtransferase